MPSDASKTISSSDADPVAAKTRSAFSTGTTSDASKSANKTTAADTVDAIPEGMFDEEMEEEVEEEKGETLRPEEGKGLCCRKRVK